MLNFFINFLIFKNCINKKMSSKAVHVLTDVFLIISSAGILLSVLFAATNLLDNNYIITRLTKSWKRSPISHVQASREWCVMTHTNQLSITNYNWPGNLPGCNCMNIAPKAFKARKYRGKYFSGSCIYNQTLAGCEEIGQTPIIPMNKWKNTFFCHRGFPENYFNLITVKKGHECPIYYKNCGKIDTLENEICLKYVEDCPINHIIFDPDTKFLKIDSSTQNTNGFIFSEFHVTDSDKVCINNDENLFTENKYLLMVEKFIRNRRGCQSSVDLNGGKLYHDNRFKLLDSYSKKLYYEHAGMHVVDILPQFLDLTGNNNVKLFGAPFIGWNKDCMYIGEKSILEEFSNLGENLDKIEFNNKKLIYCSTLLLIYIGLLIFYLKYKYSKIEDKDLTIPDSFYNNFLAIYAVFAVINIYIVYLVQANKNLIYLNQSNTQFFDSLFNENCSDNETNASLRHFGREFFSNISRYNYMRIFIILNIISSIFICVFGNYTKRKPDNVIYNYDSFDKKEL